MIAAKKYLFIDRDGTLIKEAPPTYQLDSFEKLEFYPDVFFNMRRIMQLNIFDAVMVTNQDGMGTNAFPEKDFTTVHNFVLRAFENEAVVFKEILIDTSYPADNKPTRKPGTGLLTHYINNPTVDMAGSYVIGDRITDMKLAANLGCKGIWLNDDESLGAEELDSGNQWHTETIILKTRSWSDIFEFLQKQKTL